MRAGTPPRLWSQTPCQGPTGPPSGSQGQSSRCPALSPPPSACPLNPIFVVHGDKDLLVPQSDVEGLTRMAPVKKVVVLRETGHNPEIERPNTLNRVLLDLLTQEQSSDLTPDVA